MLGLTVQNFVSAGVGICVLMVLIRGFIRTKSDKLGNFWIDLTKSVLYILLPISIILAIFLTTQGVVQSFSSYKEVSLLEPMTLSDGNVIDKQIIPLGPAASQIAIKQLGTNGGGFFGTNSSHPFENPNMISNFVQVVSIILIPAALCTAFGDMLKDKKQGNAILAAMISIFIVCIASCMYFEYKGTPEIADNPNIEMSVTNEQSGGNMEGKEVRFGGVGCGLYGMLAFAILTVFISGLMVGRTPEYLGKKIEPNEMKMASILIITTPVLVLIGSAIICSIPNISNLLNNSGAHGFSEILYALSSVANNNGSAFAGFGANNVFINL